ncbi:MAG: YicC/YloC family endoribonuclease [bacterium]
MPYSMTGMGRASGIIRKPLIKFDVEIKSYNHRFLEISVKCPSTLLPFEDEIRRCIQKKVTRGHIVVFIQQDREILDTKVELDESLLRAYMAIVDKLEKEHKINGKLDINTLLSVQGLVKFSQPVADSRDIFDALKPILSKALKSFLEMKKREGKNIERDIRKSICIIEKNIQLVEKLIPERNRDYKSHLEEIGKKFDKELNEDRFYQELLYTIDRTDVNEECKRLSSHLVLFKEALDNDKHCGRKLNFLLQEIQREANTCSVKANFLEISKSVVQIKEEVEKIREQVQNIE